VRVFVGVFLVEEGVGVVALSLVIRDCSWRLSGGMQVRMLEVLLKSKEDGLPCARRGLYSLNAQATWYICG